MDVWESSTQVFGVLKYLNKSGLLLLRFDISNFTAENVRMLDYTSTLLTNGLPLPAAYKHSLLQLSPIATYDESDWTSECEAPYPLAEKAMFRQLAQCDT
ncbi:hypothetical protein AVEN_123859-1 [Araneus ventricosus]|uniref:Uncharacterized protein n=1 Tax=Araneus ventricosus TaxID=182803 RepID=A0A4Y2GCC6_ARAVE|nr:hypothetical protein AVEN_123859-1 [Araneus ventricosus]